MANRITESNKKFLAEYVARLAFQDYYNANKKSIDKKTKCRKDGTRAFIPYSLSDETQEAQHIYSIACHAEHTPDEVEAVKAFILRAKLRRDELKYKNAN